ncbi:MAG: hypothetical protein ACLSHM_01595 [Vescimonas sp.]
MVLGKVPGHQPRRELLQPGRMGGGSGGRAFAIGGAVVRQTGVTLPLLEVLRGAGRLTGSVQRSRHAGGAAGLLPGGILCCIAVCPAIGGVHGRGRPRDLSGTNVLFSLVLVAGFFCCMFAGGMDGMTSSARWLDSCCPSPPFW